MTALCMYNYQLCTVWCGVVWCMGHAFSFPKALLAICTQYFDIPEEEILFVLMTINLLSTIARLALLLFNLHLLHLKWSHHQ